MNEKYLNVDVIKSNIYSGLINTRLGKGNANSNSKASAAASATASAASATVSAATPAKGKGKVNSLNSNESDLNNDINYSKFEEFKQWYNSQVEDIIDTEIDAIKMTVNALVEVIIYYINLINNSNKCSTLKFYGDKRNKGNSF